MNCLHKQCCHYPNCECDPHEVKAIDLMLDASRDNLSQEDKNTANQIGQNLSKLNNLARRIAMENSTIQIYKDFNNED